MKQRGTIVVVEDEAILARVVVEKLEHEGFNISLAMNGEDAVPLIRKVFPRLILLDIVLPEKDGFAVLQELKDDAQLASIPVIVLSNLGEDEDIKKALQLGARDYLVKTQHPLNEVIEKCERAILL